MSPFCRELSLLLLLLAHAQADNCLAAIVGETVQIPCSLNTQESLKTEDISLEWRTSEDLIVYSILKGQDYWANQAPQFKGRTQLFRSGLSHGDLSLRLSSVSVTDEGSYACYYHRAGESNSRELCQVCLQIAGDDCLTANIGETVQIPCSLNTTESLKAEDISVEWTTGDDRIVHAFVKGEGDLTNQDPQFKGRTQLLTSELSRGNFSLKLSNVSEADGGKFECIYYRAGETSSKHKSKHCLQVAGRYSDPIVTISSSVSKDSEVNFTCKSAGGYPEPKVYWSVNKVPLQDSINTRMSRDSKGRYNVTSILTLNVTGDVSVTCIIENQRLRENRTSIEVQYLTGRAEDSGKQLGPVIGVGSVVGLIVLTVPVIILMRMKRKKKKSMTPNVSREDDDIQEPLREGPDIEKCHI